MSQSTTQKTSLQSIASDEKTQAYEDYMDAFRRAQDNPSLANRADALKKYNRYLKIAALYTQGEKGLNLFRRSQ